VEPKKELDFFDQLAIEQKPQSTQPALEDEFMSTFAQPVTTQPTSSKLLDEDDFLTGLDTTTENKSAGFDQIFQATSGGQV